MFFCGQLSIYVWLCWRNKNPIETRTFVIRSEIGVLFRMVFSFSLHSFLVWCVQTRWFKIEEMKFVKNYIGYRLWDVIHILFHCVYVFFFCCWVSLCVLWLHWVRLWVIRYIITLDCCIYCIFCLFLSSFKLNYMYTKIYILFLHSWTDTNNKRKIVYLYTEKKNVWTEWTICIIMALV